MNSENSKTSGPHFLILKVTDKLDLRRGAEGVALSNLSIYYTQKHIKSSYNNNKFKILAPMYNDKFQLPDGSYSVSDIQGYFEYILKKQNGKIDIPSIRIYVNKTESRITFKIKKGYYLKDLTPAAIKLLGSSENKITKDKNGENVSDFEVLEVALVHCNIANNDYQEDLRILHTFVPNKPFGSVLDISLENNIFLKTFISEFEDIEVWFTYQNSQALEIEDRINLTLVIK